MKRWIALLTATVMMITLCACGRTEPAPDAPNNSGDAGTTLTTAADVNTTPTTRVDYDIEIEFNPDPDPEADARPMVICPKVCYDEQEGDAFTVTVDRYDFSGSKLNLYATIKSYDLDEESESFATHAVELDKDNNVLDISQVLYFRDATKSSVGQSFVDDVYLNDDTATVIILGNNANDPVLQSKNHGNTNLTLDYSGWCYDYYDPEEAAAEINSWNVVEDEVFIVFTLKMCTAAESFATRMYFYDANGTLLDDRQVMYMPNATPQTVGRVGYDSNRIPEGTVRMEIKSNKPAGSDNKPTQPADNPTKPTQPATPPANRTAWTAEDIQLLKTYCQAMTETMDSFMSFMKSSLIYSALDRKAIACRCVAGTAMSARSTMEEVLALVQSHESRIVYDNTTLEDLVVELYNINYEIYSYHNSIEEANARTVEARFEVLTASFGGKLAAVIAFADLM